MAQSNDQGDKRAGENALLEGCQDVLGAPWFQAHFLPMGV